MRKFFRRHIPDPATLGKKRMFSMMGKSLFHPGLWFLNRRSAARGVAIGMFCGLIPGPLQMLGAALVCLAVRANLPIALATTFYTNPLTIVPLYIAAFSIGSWLMGAEASFVMPPEMGTQSLTQWATMLWRWMMGLGQPLAIGLLVLATLLALLGYAVVLLLWRLHVIRALRRRSARRTSNL